MKRTFGLAACGLTLVLIFNAVNFADTPTSPRTSLKYHQPPKNAVARMQRQADFDLPSVLVHDDGTLVKTADDWHNKRRVELVQHWTRILGKLQPTTADQRWFGDINNARVGKTTELEGYTRIELELPIEKDFQQPHLLLLPKGQGKGPFPAVIAWTSTSPDYRKPEEWWGSWLARRGFVVLTGWSFIRHYRGGINYSHDVNEAVYERFGHWLPMAKMVHDVQREVEFLRGRAEVDAENIGFIGFSLSAKAALYVAAFAPEIKATVAVDPHIAIYGATNWHDPWYLDSKHKFPSIHTADYPDPELRGTVWSLLDTNPERPGFERNHHELLALAAPRSLMVIGCSMDKEFSGHSDDLGSWAYINRAVEVYKLLGIPERLRFVTSTEGHCAVSPSFDAEWQGFFTRWLKKR
ncbi:MAG: dienelactone hydrolase family protein [Planctomycetota bacterium]|nr:dienelactone hydrolase family protein [Planctomycetota bacterium]